ncbi:MAG: hypothetical protein RSB67_03920, partial [Clostridia bacterium]
DAYLFDIKESKNEGAGSNSKYKKVDGDEIDISNNVNIKTVSARLGHSTIATTMNIYTHALSEDDKKVSELI